MNNLRVLNHLKNTVRYDGKQDWYRHWVEEGFAALEIRLQQSGRRGRYCFGDIPGLADAFLVPQVYNALRFDCDMQPFPLIDGIYRQCLKEPAFIKAAPENQPMPRREP